MAPTTSPHYVGNSSLKFDEVNSHRIPPQDLTIVWGRDNRYWNVPENRNQAAELYQVSWLEVTGSVEGTSPNKNYEVGFKVSFTPDAFGWGTYPIYIMVKRGKNGKFAWTKYTVNPNETEMIIKGKLMKTEKQGQDPENQKLYFGLYEVWSGKWKGGLKLHHAFVKELP